MWSSNPKLRSMSKLYFRLHNHVMTYCSLPRSFPGRRFPCFAVTNSRLALFTSLTEKLDSIFEIPSFRTLSSEAATMKTRSTRQLSSSLGCSGGGLNSSSNLSGISAPSKIRSWYIPHSKSASRSWDLFSFFCIPCKFTCSLVELSHVSKHQTYLLQPLLTK